MVLILKMFYVCFRTSTSACRCPLTSEFPTVTWRSCSSAAHPSTSRSADAPAEPRWSVSVCVCVCVCYLYCFAVLLPDSLCACYHGNWPGVRSGWIHLESQALTSCLKAHQIRSQYSGVVWSCGLVADCLRWGRLCMLEVSQQWYLLLKKLLLMQNEHRFWFFLKEQVKIIAFIGLLVFWCIAALANSVLAIRT